MSEKYNNRINEIRKKIRNISINPTEEEDQEEKEIDSKINILEENFRKKCSDFNNKINSLKDDFLTMTYSYEAFRKKKNFDLLPNQLQSMNYKISIESKLSLNKTENTENIKLRFNFLENKIKKINLENKRHKKIFGMNDLVKKMKNEAKKSLDSIDKKIKEEKEETSKILINLGKDLNKQIDVTKNLIREEENNRENNMNILSNNVKEIENQIDEEFKKNKNVREEFEDNIYKLLEETCVRLAKLANKDDV